MRTSFVSFILAIVFLLCVRLRSAKICLVFIGRTILDGEIFFSREKKKAVFIYVTGELFYSFFSKKFPRIFSKNFPRKILFSFSDYYYFYKFFLYKFNFPQKIVVRNFSKKNSFFYLSDDQFLRLAFPMVCLYFIGLKFFVRKKKKKPS